MKIQFDTAFNSSYLCQPVYSLEGKLLAVELICRFSSTDSKLIMPTELVLNLLTTQQLIRFLEEQTAWVRVHRPWFEKHNVLLNISVDEKLTDLLIENVTLREAIKALSFVNISVSESFPQLSQGRKNERLVKLKKHFPLWLENFGSGNANMAAVFDGLFSFVKLDKGFFWQLFTSEHFALVLPSLLRNINRYCRHVIVDGVDSEEYLAALNITHVQGIKGLLWPAVESSQLDLLLIKPSQFT